MKKYQLLFPIILISLTSCGTINRMNDLINQSTESINANKEAVDRSTEVIQQNKELIIQSNKAIEENRHHLETLSAS